MENSEQSLLDSLQSDENVTISTDNIVEEKNTVDTTEQKDNKEVIENNTEQDNKENTEEKLTEDQISSKFEEIKNKDISERTDEENSFYNENKPQIEKYHDTYVEAFGDLGIDVSNYENTHEGNNKMAIDFAKEGAKIYAKQAFEQYPELKSLYEHRVEKGLSLETFLLQNQQTDFKSFDIKTEDGQIGIISHHFSKQGLGKDEIDLIVEGFKNKGQLEEKSKGISSLLEEKHNKEIQSKLEKEEQDKIEQEKQYEETVSSVKNIIEKGEILGLNIPEKDKSGFLNYMFNHDNEGNTESIKKFNNLTLDQKLYLEYLIYNDFKTTEKQTKSKNNLDNDFSKRSNVNPSNITKKDNTSSKGNINLDDIFAKQLSN